MDPPTGASTCALGSHRCTPYNGDFTIKAAKPKAAKALDGALDPERAERSIMGLNLISLRA